MADPKPPTAPAVDVTVVLVSYHSQADLARCLPSLERQGVAGVETIVVDHAPGDGTATWLAEVHPDVRVLANPKNTGYAGGNDLGLRHALGTYVLILNPDTELHEGALATLLDAVRAHPDALVTPKLLGPDGTVNACGNQMHPTGITTCRGLGDPADAHVGTFPVPLVSGAAFVARRDLLLELGGFDARYFMYLEDTDLSLRARSRGYRVLCAADAVVTHHYRLGMTPAKFEYLERNRLLTLFRHLEARTLRRMVVPLLLTELATWAYALLKGPAYLAARGRGYGWLWRERAWLREARAAQQSARCVDDAGLLAGSETTLPFGQLVASASVARWLERLTAPLYRWTLPPARPLA